MNGPVSLRELAPGDTPDHYEEFVSLYLRTFRVAEEREDPSVWPARMTDHPDPGQPRTRILGAIAGDGSGQCLAGGLVFEHYRASRCGLLTYLVIAPSFRRRGLGRLLVEQAIVRLRGETGNQLRAVFSEVEDPGLVDAGDDPTASPRDRLSFFTSLGARRVGLPYVQPDLGGGAGRARHLFLLCYGSALPEGVLRRTDLVAFLTEFYRALGTAEPGEDADFRAMTANLEDPVPLLELNHHEPA